MQEQDEELSPTPENATVLICLQLIQKDLPKLVKQRYRTELRSHTLASIKPEISQDMNSLLDELQCTAESRVMCSFADHAQPRWRNSRSSSTQFLQSFSVVS